MTSRRLPRWIGPDGEMPVSHTIGSPACAWAACLITSSAARWIQLDSVSATRPPLTSLGNYTTLPWAREVVAQAPGQGGAQHTRSAHRGRTLLVRLAGTAARGVGRAWGPRTQSGRRSAVPAGGRAAPEAALHH